MKAMAKAHRGKMEGHGTDQPSPTLSKGRIATVGGYGPIHGTRKNKMRKAGRS